MVNAIPDMQPFPNHFNSAFNKVEASLIQIVHVKCRNTLTNVCTLVQLMIIAQQVRSAINKLKYSTSSGPEGIPSCVLKKCIESLIWPSTVLSNITRWWCQTSFRRKMPPDLPHLTTPTWLVYYMAQITLSIYKCNVISFHLKIYPQMCLRASFSNAWFRHSGWGVTLDSALSFWLYNDDGDLKDQSTITIYF